MVAAGAGIVVVFLTLATTKSFPTSALMARTDPSCKVTGSPAVAALEGPASTIVDLLEALRPGLGLIGVGGLVPCSNCTVFLVLGLAGEGDLDLGTCGGGE